MTQTGQENGGNMLLVNCNPAITIRTRRSRRNHKSSTVKSFLTSCGRGASLARAKFVMPGLVPGIHVLLLAAKAWMAGTSPAMTKSG
jgi:hypothetical protein